MLGCVDNLSCGCGITQAGVLGSLGLTLAECGITNDVYHMTAQDSTTWQACFAKSQGQTIAQAYPIATVAQLVSGGVPLANAVKAVVDATVLQNPSATVSDLVAKGVPASVAAISVTPVVPVLPNVTIVTAPVVKSVPVAEALPNVTPTQIVAKTVNTIDFMKTDSVDPKDMIWDLGRPPIPVVVSGLMDFVQNHMLAIGIVTVGVIGWMVTKHE